MIGLESLAGFGASLVQGVASIKRAPGLRSALFLVGLVALVILPACNDDEGDTALSPTAERTAAGATGTPEGTPAPTPSGELSLSFKAECGAEEDAPELTVTIRAVATDDAIINKVRVFVDGIQGLEREVDSAKEFDEPLSLATTPGSHDVRVSAEGDGLQVVSRPQEVTCPGTPEAGE